MTWQPQPELLNQLLQGLQQTGSADTQVQAQVRQLLSQFTQHPDYNNYLAFILAQPQAAGQPSLARNMAGLLLKTNLSTTEARAHITRESLEIIKHAAFVAVQDNVRDVQKTAGILMAAIVSVDISQAGDVLQRLAGLLQSPAHVVEAAFVAIKNICEDSADKLDSAIVHGLLPLFIANFEHQIPKVRALAISSTNQFVLARPRELGPFYPQYVQGLYQRANDPDKEVRKNVCQGIVMTLEANPDALAPQLNAVIGFMLSCTESGDSDVALEACEFWLAFAEHEEFLNQLEPFLGELIRVLVKGMVYSEDELQNLGGEKEDAHIADRAEDIKPRFHKAKIHTNELTEEQKKALAAQKQQNPNAAAEEEDDDDLDDDDDDDTAGGEWTLRKCSAAALDILSTVLGDTILIHLLPILKNLLLSPDWKQLESGVLALGAIAEGCGQGVEPHLKDLVKFMTDCLLNPQPLVRSITCWTLGRYSHWIIYGPDEGERDPNHTVLYFQPVLQGLLTMVLDNSKRVQEAGCSALATLEEDACDALVPYLPHILQTLATAFGKYQNKNLLILYDAVGTLADSVGHHLNQPQFIPVLLSPLIAKWSVIHDDSRDIFPLLECLSSVAIALGAGFKDMAQPVWERCMRIIKQTLMARQMYQQNPQTHDEPDMDFVIVALDLLSGISQGLHLDVGPLVHASQPDLMEMLLMCMRDVSNDVRQSAYALLGDLAISSFGHVQQYIEKIIPMIVYQIDQKNDQAQLSVCNNATWAAGEISLQMGSGMEQFVDVLLPRLVEILANSDETGRGRTLLENAAITIGRLAYVAPARIAPHVEGFFVHWCKALGGLRDNNEKESAFLGLCAMVAANPQVACRFFPFLAHAIVGWHHPSASLNEQFVNILVNLKALFGAQWPAQLQGLPINVKDKIRVRYQLQ